MPTPHSDCEIEEHELPCVEAVLAGTLALMTGYAQSLQAAIHPEQRLLMGHKITRQLALLADREQLSTGFRAVLDGLRQRWLAMSACTEAAERDCSGEQPAPQPPQVRYCFDAPTRLQ
jgi:hypothetical protein